MRGVPAQRQAIGWSVEIAAPEGAPEDVRWAIESFLTEANADPRAMISMLTRRTGFGDELILASPRQIMGDAAISDPDPERVRALDALTGLFRTGADQYIQYDPITRRVLDAAAYVEDDDPDNDPDIARTRHIHLVLGLLGMALDARHPDPLPRAPRSPFAPEQDA